MWVIPVLVGVVGPAGLVPSVTRAAAAPAAEEPAARAKSEFEAGVSRYQQSDYAAAIERFSASFDASTGIEDPQLRANVLHALQFNLARAHMKMYGIDRDLQHVRVALDLLDKYLQDAADLGIDPEAETLRAQAGEVLAQAETSSAAEETVASGSDGADEGGDGGAKGMVLGGYVSLGLAAASLGVMGGGLAIGAKADGDFDTATTESGVDEARSNGKVGNAMVYAGVASAVVFGGVGAALLVLGKKKQRGKETARIHWAPALGTTHAGVTLGGRF